MSPPGTSPAGYGSRAWQTPADSRLVQALVSRCWQADWPHQHFHAGDIDWWSVHALGRMPGLGERIRLWFAGEPDATELVGFAWYGPPNDADLQVEPGHRRAELLGQMVGWVEAQVERFGLTAPGRLGGLDSDAAEAPDGATRDGTARARIWAVASEARTVAALAALGLEPGPEPGFVHHCAGLDELELDGPSLPDGYALQTIAGDADIAGRVAAGHAAFPGSTMTEEKYRFCRSTPLYRPGLDTIVVAPDGSIAAFALGWLDPLTMGIELEPVGTHPDHQRRGLGAAISRATLRVARAMGGRQVLIAAEAANPAANALYDHLGLPVRARVVAFQRTDAGLDLASAES